MRILRAVFEHPLGGVVVTHPLGQVNSLEASVFNVLGDLSTCLETERSSTGWMLMDIVPDMGNPMPGVPCGPVAGIGRGVDLRIGVLRARSLGSRRSL